MKATKISTTRETSLMWRTREAAEEVVAEVRLSSPFCHTTAQLTFSSTTESYQPTSRTASTTDAQPYDSDSDLDADKSTPAPETRPRYARGPRPSTALVDEDESYPQDLDPSSSISKEQAPQASYGGQSDLDVQQGDRKAPPASSYSDTDYDDRLNSNPDAEDTRFAPTSARRDARDGDGLAAGDLPSDTNRDGRRTAPVGDDYDQGDSREDGKSRYGTAAAVGGGALLGGAAVGGAAYAANDADADQDESRASRSSLSESQRLVPTCQTAHSWQRGLGAWSLLLGR